MFEGISRVHCIGIGGIGVSAMARLLLDQEKVVSGSDQNDSELTQKLSEEGVDIMIGHDAHNVTEDIDLIVYSPAISEDNPEMQMAKEYGITTSSYPEMLGKISESMFTIAIAGTHGKTTTTAMTASVLEAAELQPTVIVGSLLKDKQSNYIPGNGSIFVVEACEYKRSFTHLKPDIIAITNVEEDHMDYYKSLDDIKDAYRELLANIKEGGVVITNLCRETEGDITADVLANVDDYSIWTVPEEVQLIGNHNYENAKVVMAIAARLKVPEEDVVKGFQNFKGTWRRMEDKGTLQNGAVWIDDYAHHPTEVKTTLAGIREANPDKKIHVIFEPHLHSRTQEFMNQFGESFSDADHVYVVPIYEARHEEGYSITHADVVEKIIQNDTEATQCDTIEDCKELVLESTDKNSVVVTMGAGNVYKVFE